MEFWRKARGKKCQFPLNGASFVQPVRAADERMTPEQLSTSLAAFTGRTRIVVHMPEAVTRFVAEDPYSKVGLFERVEIRPWNCDLGRIESAVPDPMADHP